MWPKYVKPFYFHFRDMKKLNAVTVCLNPIGEGEQVFKVGFACCASHDNFSKRVGRNVAEGRAKQSTKTIEAANFDELLNKARIISEEAENGILYRRQRR